MKAGVEQSQGTTGRHGWGSSGEESGFPTLPGLSAPKAIFEVSELNEQQFTTTENEVG